MKRQLQKLLALVDSSDSLKVYSHQRLNQNQSLLLAHNVVAIQTTVMAIAIAIVVVVVSVTIVLNVQLKVQQALKVQMLHAKRVQVGAAKTVATATGITAIATRIIKIRSQKIKLR